MVGVSKYSDSARGRSIVMPMADGHGTVNMPSYLFCVFAAV